MSCTLHSDNCAHYASVRRLASASMPGVSFTIHRMSFGRRTELLRKVRELTRKLGYLEAGQSLEERAEAALLGRDVDRAYLEWGLVQVEGLEIDGAPATPESVVAGGPETLCEEILQAIQRECGLNAEERKN